jgi:curved DNA-binding protein CbpA
MENKDYYKVLGVLSSATNDEIAKAFRKKNMENHPDRLGINENSEVWKIANDYIKLLNEAYRVLSDPLLRKKYDEDHHFNTPKNDSTEKRNKKSTYSANTNIKKTPIIFNYERSSFQLKNILMNRQNKEHIHKVKNKGVIPSYIGSVIFFAWFPILYSFLIQSMER